MLFLFSLILCILIFRFGNLLLQPLKITIIVLVFRFAHKNLLSIDINDVVWGLGMLYAAKTKAHHISQSICIRFQFLLSMAILTIDDIFENRARIENARSTIAKTGGIV